MAAFARIAAPAESDRYDGEKAAGAYPGVCVAGGVAVEVSNVVVTKGGEGVVGERVRYPFVMS